LADGGEGFRGGLHDVVAGCAVDVDVEEGGGDCGAGEVTDGDAGGDGPLGLGVEGGDAAVFDFEDGVGDADGAIPERGGGDERTHGGMIAGGWGGRKGGWHLWCPTLAGRTGTPQGWGTRFVHGVGLVDEDFFAVGLGGALLAEDDHGVFELGAGGGELGVEFGEALLHFEAELFEIVGDPVGLLALLDLIFLDGFEVGDDGFDHEAVELAECVGDGGDAGLGLGGFFGHGQILPLKWRKRLITKVSLRARGGRRAEVTEK